MIRSADQGRTWKIFSTITEWGGVLRQAQDEDTQAHALRQAQAFRQAQDEGAQAQTLRQAQALRQAQDEGAQAQALRQAQDEARR